MDHFPCSFGDRHFFFLSSPVRTYPSYRRVLMDSPPWPDGGLCPPPLSEASSCQAQGHLGWPIAHIALGTIWLLRRLQVLAFHSCLTCLSPSAVSFVICTGFRHLTQCFSGKWVIRPVQLFPEHHSVACLCRKATCYRRDPGLRTLCSNSRPAFSELRSDSALSP